MEGITLKMSIVVILALFVGTFCVNAQESRKEAEDCAGLKQLARYIETVGRKYSVADSCKVFSNCSGLHCSGSIFTNPFSLSIGVQHCQDPVQLWLYLRAPKLNVDESRVLTNGVKVQLLPRPVSLLREVSVQPKLVKRNGNITIGGRLCYTLLLQSACQNMNDISIPVSEKLCSMDGKSTHSAPTGRAKLSTDKIHTGATKTKPMTTKKTKVVTGMASQTPKGPHSKGSAGTGRIKTAMTNTSTARMKTNMTGTSTTVTKHSHHSGASHMGDHNGSKARPALSTGAKVALVTSVLLLATLILGIFVYWRRLKNRRPAYYNDINVNREDEDPFFDSHLTL